MIRKTNVTFVFLAAVILPSAAVVATGLQQEPATLVLTNGKILTVDESLPVVPQMVMTRDGKTIVYAGVRTTSELFIVDGLH